MNPARRAWLAACAACAAVPATAPAAAHTAAEAAVQRGNALAFPRDHGAHLAARIEWWYVTGWLAATSGPAGAAAPVPPEPSHGFQVTFFRSRVTGAAAVAADDERGRFVPRHLLFAHAAITDLGGRRHLHAQRIGRWNGQPDAALSGPDRAATADAALHLARWQLARDPASPVHASRWAVQVRSESFALAGTLQAGSPPLLQGDAGFSRKGPQEHQASHYYSQPQLDAALTLEVNAGRPLRLNGRAWLDHEWSDVLLHPQAVGWDWIGINLFDGSALTAFRLRRADGSALWAGGSWRAGSAAAGAARSFAPDEVRFEPERRWRSAATNASYPVQWQVHTPAGVHTVRALLDAQELDGRAGTGAVYWEGLAELLEASGRRIGLGYLEMTGYASPLKLAG
ncbi:MAG: carotenoid 1,2-hydratase [Rubrivivax sp.]|nr:carotenoid 1,2-hydratase [Rubrivivax sp.]